MNIPYKDKVLTTRPRESYPDSVNKEIALISFWKKGLPTPFGSYIYRMQKYAGDIDLLETFKYPKELTVIQQFIKALKKIITHLGTMHYFSEFKAGLDKVYEIDIGELRSGNYIPHPNLEQNLKIKFKQGLFSKEEYEYMIQVLSNLNFLPINEKSMAYDTLFNLIREKRILRWTSTEILRGYKLIRGEKYTLANALRDKTIVKIDLIVLINNRFIEVTNILSLIYVENGENISINIDDKLIHDIDQLRNEVEKLYYSNKFYSPLKACKRMYSLSRATKNYTFIVPLANILRSDVSLFYQIKSEIDALIIILEKIKSTPIKHINNQLSEIKARIANILDLSNSEVIEISNNIDRIIKIKNKKLKLSALKDHNDVLKNFISDLTINKMNINTINPPPRILLPYEVEYSRDIIRKVGERPTKVYKAYENKIIEDIIKINEIKQENLN